jgi:hypothetical protein
MTCRSARSVGMMAKRAVSVMLLFAALLLVPGSAVARAATPQRIARANQTAAVAAARQLLADVALPAHPSKVGSAPAGSRLGKWPWTRLFFAAQVDRSAFWTTRAAPATVIDSIKAHLPHGAQLGQGAYTGSESLASFTLPTIDPASLVVQQLAIEAISLPNGTTAVRADGEVQYIAPRPVDELVPSQARVLQITITNHSPKPLLSLSVRNPAQVRRIASMVNALPFGGNMQGAVFNCPDFTASEAVDTFVFRADPGGPILAKVTELATTPATLAPCTTTSLTIRGRKEPELMDGGVLLNKAGALLNVRLARS